MSASHALKTGVISPSLTFAAISLICASVYDF